jgi:hypothetical protein
MDTLASAARLRRAIDEVAPLLAVVEEARTTVRPAPGKWCAREVLGHLIDSACNNHRRFVLAQDPDMRQWEAYRQDPWVSAQDYAGEPWSDLVGLWTAYNRHLARVMAITPAAIAAREASSADGSKQLSVAFIMDDYVTHVIHHLDQLRTLLG